jgi:hypothetical protein
LPRLSTVKLSTPDVSVTVAGKVTVLKLPEIGPLTWTLPAPHKTLPEQVPPPIRVTPPVRVRVPVMVGLAVVGGVAASVAGNDNVTVPAVADGAMVPKRISAGSDRETGGRITALTGILLVAALALTGNQAKINPATPQTRAVCSIALRVVGFMTGSGPKDGCLSLVNHNE